MHYFFLSSFLGTKAPNIGDRGPSVCVCVCVAIRLYRHRNLAGKIWSVITAPLWPLQIASMRWGSTAVTANGRVLYRGEGCTEESDIQPLQWLIQPPPAGSAPSPTGVMYSLHFSQVEVIYFTEIGPARILHKVDAQSNTVYAKRQYIAWISWNGASWWFTR